MFVWQGFLSVINSSTEKYIMSIQFIDLTTKILPSKKQTSFIPLFQLE